MNDVFGATLHQETQAQSCSAAYRRSKLVAEVGVLVVASFQSKDELRRIVTSLFKVYDKDKDEYNSLSTDSFKRTFACSIEGFIRVGSQMKTGKQYFHLRWLLLQEQFNLTS